MAASWRVATGAEAQTATQNSMANNRRVCRSGRRTESILLVGANRMAVGPLGGQKLCVCIGDQGVEACGVALLYHARTGAQGQRAARPLPRQGLDGATQWLGDAMA